MKNIRIKILTILISGFLLPCLILYGCGSTSSKSSASDDISSSYDNASSSQMTEAGTSEEVAAEESINYLAGSSMEGNADAKDDALNSDNADVDDFSLDATPADATKKQQNEKLIYTYHYSVETKEFDSFTEKVTSKTIQLGGYVENSETSGSAEDGLNRYANMTLRIPADQVNQILTMLDSESNVTYRNSSIDNISLQYVDLESHIKALRTEQETLLRLIEKAEKLKDIISLQSQLTQVRYEIESYESQLRMYDNLIDYSTIHLDISEVERTTTLTPSRASFGKEVKDRFSDNLYAVGQWLRSLAVWLIGSLPIIVPIAILIAIIIFILRKWSKYQKAHRPISERQEHQAGYRSIYQKKQRARSNTQDHEMHNQEMQSQATQNQDIQNHDIQNENTEQNLNNPDTNTDKQ